MNPISCVSIFHKAANISSLSNHSWSPFILLLREISSISCLCYLAFESTPATYSFRSFSLAARISSGWTKMKPSGVLGTNVSADKPGS